MAATRSLPELQAMKKRGEKIAGVVAWDYQMARIADRAGADIISVGDSVGVNLWGHANPLEVTQQQIIIVASAVRRGTTSALLSVDFPFGPLQAGVDSAVRCAIELVKAAGADLVKLDGAAAYPDAVEAVTRAGIPVWAQFGVTPQTALTYGIPYSAMSDPDAQLPPEMTEQMISEARLLEDAGASLLNFTNSGPVVGPEVVAAVDIPVLGGFGGGPWLDGRIRMSTSAIGYAESMIDDPRDTYANVGAIAYEALQAYVGDVRAGKQVKSGRPG
ncbi:3-methyl-2-oxobutanoate hydroxymethyltransferase [Egicoccus sp. AB-alg2]|uniref:3-methyl-2-oxobutanoate hydroxymethyltransferase n=1 Tax=Egicoccus sp. AB-alg2 TaxID=3242693 RepID=UPI00359E29A4